MTPVLGVIAVVLRGDQVLLVQRGKAPDRGLWAYPGGAVNWGEPVAQAALRELREETGVIAAPGPLIGQAEVIRRAGGADHDADQHLVTHHYFIAAVLCHYQSGEPRAADDAADARWVSQQAVLQGDLPMSKDVERVLKLALKQA